MYKLLESARSHEDLFNGFSREIIDRSREAISIKSIPGIFHVRTLLKDVFGFAEHKEKGTYGLG